MITYINIYSIIITIIYIPKKINNKNLFINYFLKILKK